ncbi:ferrous iron transport protein B [Bacteroidetes bacterium endosymbiont of Geopemphigus sp.]|uniref:ferrous iron transport protein B n=1 Tax=Bacteroidetes bacterium endosymbiont of Geopemphigus sp. TaxID=2047937 RepID=UPI000CD28B25|nr:ferrous iron transport protein B [Bacteroidetes bacterium endosymbiont of Geopemphigus sp.]
MNVIKVALIGNPNVGKTTLFNKLTGLHQKIGNYPGVTVDKKVGFFNHEAQYQLTDLPGTYSLYPSSQDEEVVFNILTDSQHPDHPDKVIVILDASQLRRGLLLFHQVQDLGFPVLLVLNMMDEAKKKGIHIELDRLMLKLSVEVVAANVRKGIGLSQIKEKLIHINTSLARRSFNPDHSYGKALDDFRVLYGIKNHYLAWAHLVNKQSPLMQNDAQLRGFLRKHFLIPKRLQTKEILMRYACIEKDLSDILHEQGGYSSRSERIDRWVTHPFWGYLIFFSILFFIFQGVYTWAEIPKSFIEDSFSIFQEWMHHHFPEGPINIFLSQGLIPGLSAIVLFIPQIVILFFFLLLMEESGYIGRVVFLMDRWMRPFGLNGKSVMPLISGVACAIPAVMSARNIENPRDRLITILVTPLMTCSARLPVYTLMIALVIPDKYWMGFQLKGLVLMIMYFLGVLAALCTAMVFNKLLRRPYKSYLIMEMPSYKWPIFKHILLSLWIRLHSFLWHSGKIIMAVSIILWVLSSFGPDEVFFYHRQETVTDSHPIKDFSDPLERSYLGIIGKGIEPVLKPLGYDWKIGIGLLSSLAAREVFVSTMASVYSIGSTSSNSHLEEKMKTATRANGQPVYDLATGGSLMIFYAFAMQCMSTLTVVRRETKSWKWPIVQFFFMTGMAYLGAFAFYKIFS